jgi:hypothetical protein
LLISHVLILSGDAELSSDYEVLKGTGDRLQDLRQQYERLAGKVSALSKEKIRSVNEKD